MSSMCGNFSMGGYEGYCSCGGTGCTPYRGPRPEPLIGVYTHTLKKDGFFHPIKRGMDWKERREHLESLRRK